MKEPVNISFIDIDVFLGWI